MEDSTSPSPSPRRARGKRAVTMNETPTGTEDRAAEQPVLDAEPSEAAEAPDAPGSIENADSGQQQGDPKWRARYREIETQLVIEQARSAEATRLIGEMQRAEVERLVAVHLQDPSDLWRDGTSLDDLLGDDGHIDPQRVEEAAQQIKDTHPHWARRTPVIGAPASAVTGDGKIPSAATQPTWGDLLGGKHTG